MSSAHQPLLYPSFCFAPPGLLHWVDADRCRKAPAGAVSALRGGPNALLLQHRPYALSSPSEPDGSQIIHDQNPGGVALGCAKVGVDSVD